MDEPEIDENKDKELDPTIFEDADEVEDSDDNSILVEGADPLLYNRTKISDGHQDPEVDSVEKLIEEEETEEAEHDGYDDVDLL